MLYVFGPQILHVMAPPSLKLPAGHHVHSEREDAPDLFENDPLGHSWHVPLPPAPIITENLPGVHMTQTEA